MWQGPESEGNELDFENNDFEDVDSDYEIDFIDGIVSDWKMASDLSKAIDLVSKDWGEYFNLPNDLPAGPTKNLLYNKKFIINFFVVRLN